MDYSKWDHIDDVDDGAPPPPPPRRAPAVASSAVATFSVHGLRANGRLSRLVQSSRRGKMDERRRALLHVAQEYRSGIIVAVDQDDAAFESHSSVIAASALSLRSIAAVAFADTPVARHDSRLDATLAEATAALSSCAAQLDARCAALDTKDAEATFCAEGHHDDSHHQHHHSHACSHAPPATRSAAAAPPNHRSPWPTALRARCTAALHDASLLRALLQLRRCELAASADTLRDAILASPRSSPAWLLRGRAFLSFGAASSAGGLLLGLLHVNKCLAAAGRHPDHVSDSLAIDDERSGLWRVIRPLAEEYPGYDGDGEGGDEAQTPLTPLSAGEAVSHVSVVVEAGEAPSLAASRYDLAAAERVLASPATLRGDAAAIRRSAAAAFRRRLESTSPLAACRSAEVVRLQGREGQTVAAAAAPPSAAAMSAEEAAWRERFSGAHRKAAAAAIAADPLVAHLEGTVREVLWALRGVDAAPEADLLGAEASRLQALVASDDDGGEADPGLVASEASRGGPAAALQRVAAEAAVLVHEGFFFSAAAKCAAVACAAWAAMAGEAGHDASPLPPGDLAATSAQCVACLRTAYCGSSPAPSPVADSGAGVSCERLLVAALLNSALCCLKREWGRASAVAACSGALLVLTRGASEAVLCASPAPGSVASDAASVATAGQKSSAVASAGDSLPVLPDVDGPWPGWQAALLPELPPLAPEQLLQACKALYRRGMARLGGVAEAAAAVRDFATAAAALRGHLAALRPMPSSSGGGSDTTVAVAGSAAAAAAMLRECGRGLRMARYVRSQLEERAAAAAAMGRSGGPFAGSS